jgi:putative chitinase
MSLINVQKKLGLKNDGVFGKITAKAIQNYLNLTNEQASHFLAQISHETGEFRAFAENLNYSAKGLLKTFPKYFNEATAIQYANKPEAIASRVYANRMGNGTESSRDGFKFRGRGFLQLTGKENYKKFSDYIGADCVTNPDLVLTDYCLESAVFFFDKNELWDLCKEVSDKNITLLTKRINGGVHGLADRKSKTHLYYNWLTKITA